MNTGTGQDFASLLHAFALGCLEREDYDLMMEYFKSNQDYPWQELGEYQNLVALLPSFLTIEAPEPRVKDMVARKLYRLRDQQRPQRTTQIIPPGSPAQHKNLFERIETPEQKLFSQISSPLSEEEKTGPEPQSIDESFESVAASVNKTSDFEPVSSEKDSFTFEPEKEVTPSADYSSPFSADEDSKEEEPYSSGSSDSSFSSNFDEIESGNKEIDESKDEFSFESSLSNYSLSHESSPKTDEAFSSFTSETMIEEPAADKEEAPVVVEKVKSGVSPFVFALTFIVLAGAIAIVYYYLSSNFKIATERQSAKYETIVHGLKSELSSTKEVDELLASINLQMVALKSTPKAAGAYGKLLFDSVTRNAMLQVVNLPVLSSDKVYQLWVISNKQNLSSGMYEVTASKQYFPVTNFSNLNLSGQTTFLITEEISTGGVKPSKDVYLAGQIDF
ncbi:MAG: hypothetical protein COW85_09690 [Ignavibacteria bacterium CG22_combo_CG10-13_8_21_14_all_37_15]|nr:anti-sigma factor [Ignavibacteria bacterium]OIO13678.1 MAG: hypothetical protein AUJ54_15900 [Ignavibacteria bacterium CG1_02_37_35]PIP77306.1 MAG: hypothetical protein COW85_09690 [Ignavibacteria bacterium CG22_combo_CG10-13_8_21_14_all_37_15]PIS45977.1 MAG: hypothetical protein COT22_02455 [Ignavibacteria bacterium CG08_land_8_20_14_0_20_37_9]PJC58557.1 MAG: hypothetical protein CO025_08945 [Ignavibacteria bacterium CG_4_9_14_0_2_um_filter_37_13]